LDSNDDQGWERTSGTNTPACTSRAQQPRHPIIRDDRHRFGAKPCHDKTIRRDFQRRLACLNMATPRHKLVRKNSIDDTDLRALFRHDATCLNRAPRKAKGANRSQFKQACARLPTWMVVLCVTPDEPSPFCVRRRMSYRQALQLEVTCSAAVSANRHEMNARSPTHRVRRGKRGHQDSFALTPRRKPATQRQWRYP
jgi:hypothetical protein